MIKIPGKRNVSRERNSILDGDVVERDSGRCIISFGAKLLQKSFDLNPSTDDKTHLRHNRSARTPFTGRLHSICRYEVEPHGLPLGGQDFTTRYMDLEMNITCLIAA